MPALNDLIGKRFGKLTAIELVGINRHRKAIWMCKCDCGSTTKVTRGDLKTGNTKTCGCAHPFIAHPSKHGMHGTPIHNTWSGIIERCFNKNSKDYKNYGGRGISVCDRWLFFPNFYEDMGDRPPHRSIERVNNNDGHYPANCKWGTATEQARNTRLHPKNTSGVAGVRRSPTGCKSKPWAVDIGVDGRLKYLGVYATIKEAAKARRAGEIKYWGKANPPA